MTGGGGRRTSLFQGRRVRSRSSGAPRVSLNVEDWGGFIGQWDDRRWVAKDISIPGQPSKTEHDDYAEMTGIRPGYIKRADLARSEERRVGKQRRSRGAPHH